MKAAVNTVSLIVSRSSFLSIRFSQFVSSRSRNVRLRAMDTPAPIEPAVRSTRRTCLKGPYLVVPSYREPV